MPIKPNVSEFVRLYKESVELSQGAGLSEVVVTRRRLGRKKNLKRRPPPMEEEEEEDIFQPTTVCFTLRPAATTW